MHRSFAFFSVPLCLREIISLRATTYSVESGLSAACRKLNILPNAGWCVKQIEATPRRHTGLT
jgi:hypothetical protein